MVMEQTLINTSKYNGLYVAVKDFDDNTVIASGKEPQEVYKKAIKNGFNDPVILYVPLKDTIQIYLMHI